VKGIWLLLAAAVDPRIQKVWVDRTPYRFSEALHNTLNANLLDAVIHGFALRWEIDDLRRAMAARPVMWTDPSNWMGRVEFAGPRYQYRWVLGDLTEMSETQDLAFVRQFMSSDAGSR
jgi:hypothetical protein